MTTTTRPLTTYRITLDITIDDRRFSHPAEWDWPEILDPNADAGITFSVNSVEPVALNQTHAESIRNYDLPMEGNA